MQHSFKGNWDLGLWKEELSYKEQTAWRKSSHYWNRPEIYTYKRQKYLALPFLCPSGYQQEFLLAIFHGRLNQMLGKQFSREGQEIGGIV